MAGLVGSQAWALIHCLRPICRPNPFRTTLASSEQGRPSQTMIMSVQGFHYFKKLLYRAEQEAHDLEKWAIMWTQTLPTKVSKPIEIVTSDTTVFDPESKYARRSKSWLNQDDRESWLSGEMQGWKSLNHVTLGMGGRLEYEDHFRDTGVLSGLLTLRFVYY